MDTQSSDSDPSTLGSMDLTPEDIARFETMCKSNELNPRVQGESADDWYGRVMHVLKRHEKRGRDSSPEPASPSESPSDDSDTECRMVRMADRAKWEKQGIVFYDPPDPLAAETIAKAKRPCLKAPKERKHDMSVGDDGSKLTVHSCEDLVKAKLDAGAWRLVQAESWQSMPTKPARVWLMEFIVPADEKESTWPYTKEIKMAGYSHWSACGTNGWEPFVLKGMPEGSKGWGKEVTDMTRLADWYAECAFRTPEPHSSGNGWLCNGQHYTRAAYPRADKHGPEGLFGPPW